MTPKIVPICDSGSIHAYSLPFSCAVARLWRMWVSCEKREAPINLSFLQDTREIKVSGQRSSGTLLGEEFS
jgi:hypothetical protein